MALQLIDLTTPQPGGKFGDPTKTAWEKTNDNIEEIGSRLEGAEVGGSNGSEALSKVNELQNDLGSAAYLQANELANSSQGAKADTAVQPAALVPIDQRLTTVEASQGSGIVGYPSLASIPTSSLGSGDAGKMFNVTNDANPNNNGAWRWSGTALVQAEDRVTALVQQMATKADASTTLALQLDVGPPTALSNQSLGTAVAQSVGPAGVGNLYANNKPLLSAAKITSVSVLCRSAFTGEIHILGPNPGGTTKTLAIYPISRNLSGVATIAVDFIAPKGSYIAYKQITGSQVDYGNPVGALGSARWPGTESTAVGSVQNPPVVAPTVQVAVQVSYQTTGSEPLTDQIADLTEVADKALASSTAASEFLDLTSVGAATFVAGTIEGSFTTSANSSWAYGLSESLRGGTLKKVSARYASAGSAFIEVIDKSDVVVAKHAVTVATGVNVWEVGVHFPETPLPAGGHIYLRRASGVGVLFNSQFGSSLSTANLPQAAVVGNTQQWVESPITVAMSIEYEALAKTLSESLPISIATSLIDEKFKEPPMGWSFVGCDATTGALKSQASSSWASRAIPVFYGRSQLMRRTYSAWASVVGSSEVWGLGFVRDSGGSLLDTPVATVDSAANTLTVSKWTGTGAPAVAGPSVSVPWAVTGSNMRLDISRDWFSTSVNLTNTVSGVSISITLDYEDGSGGDTGRAWGSPCVVFPQTTEGGVLISRVRMVADYPYPTAQAARVLLIGDSITEGSQIDGTPYPEHSKVWSHLLETERESLGAKDVVVMGRGGQRSSHVVQATHEAASLCDSNTVVVVLMGTNDAQTLVTQAVWRANMQLLLTKLRNRTKRIALGMLPPLGGQAKALRDSFNVDILSGYFGSDLLPPVRFDLALSLNNDGSTWNNAMQVGDGIHPSIVGNQAMFERLRLDTPEAFE